MVPVRRQAWLLLLVLPIFLIPLAGCGDDDGDDGPEMVLVSGKVIDIDRGIPAEGVRVTLLSNESVTSVAVTGEDGAYSMRVPKGTKFQTVTDDWEPGKTENWFPMINVEYPGITINGPRDDLLVHACAEASTFPMNVDDAPAGSGTISALNDYFANCSDPTRPDFGTASAEDAQGIIAFLAFRSEDMKCSLAEDYAVAIDDASFTCGYVDLDANFFFPDRSTCWFHPTTMAGTDPQGIAYCVADPAFRGSTVTLSVTDVDAMRNLTFPSMDVPVRHGTITVVVAGSVDDVGGTHFVETLCACAGDAEWPSPVPCD